MLRADIYVTSMLQQNAETSGAVVWHRRIDCRPSSPVLEVDKVHTLPFQQTFHQLCIIKYRCLDQLLTSEVSHRNLKIVHKVTMVVLYLSIIYWGSISNRDFDLGFTSLNWYIFMNSYLVYIDDTQMSTKWNLIMILLSREYRQSLWRFFDIRNLFIWQLAHTSNLRV